MKPIYCKDAGMSVNMTPQLFCATPPLSTPPIISIRHFPLLVIIPQNASLTAFGTLTASNVLSAFKVMLPYFALFVIESFPMACCSNL
ncbi:hypothetical protein [Mucilaginibacter frigoritolerans]|uniref:hypothetical protein n=1 Tax=Mucilaginibacter frigoritolerans TaxID=652788 RepID=UPI00119D013E|nr:hypothetical protein [Mucilaginibacter frigoritolerans]